MFEKKWDAEGYQTGFGFVHQYGREVADMVDIQDGCHLLDLGCGNGELASRFAERGFQVTGVDRSADMLRLAKKNYPHIPFFEADATALDFDGEFDTVFSNAVFHWITSREGQTALLRSVARSLRRGGKLVCEFGGKGCGQAVHSALRHAFEQRGYPYRMPFYFPSIGEYTPLMEAAGFRVEFASLFDRPTPIPGEDGLRNWITMFVTQPFEGVAPEDKEGILAQAEESLRPQLYDSGVWTIDYVRIRLKATKQGI